MPRYKLTIEYDGTPFWGWQRQEDGPSVQGMLEEAAFAFCRQRVDVHGGGRTDAGVHALGQVAHVDLPRDYQPGRIRDGFNALLRPAPISILSAEPVSDDFHARFSAIRRTYLYRLTDRRAPLTLDRDRVWRFRRALDVTLMQAGCEILIGRHDFTTFRDRDCQAPSPVKNLDHMEVARIGNEIQLRCHARSFLHSQVRSMVGSLTELGVGRWDLAQFEAALHARDRNRCGRVAPAKALYLVGIDYAPVDPL